MKVIHLISGLRGGGAEHLVLDLCRQSLSDPSINMKVAILAHINDITWKFHEAGIPIIAPTTPDNKRPTLFQLAAGVVSTIRQVMREKPHTIHAHMYYGAMAAAAIKIFRPKTNIIFSLHNVCERRRFNAVTLFLTKFLRNIDTIFPGTRPTWYQKQNAVPIANGINLQPYISLQPSKPAVFTCLFIGRLTGQKNPLFLINIAKSLINTHKFLIRILGDGTLEVEMRNQIKLHHLENQIQLSGYSNNIPHELASAHCLLMPSKWEGMPLAILEAGAAALPIIATPAAVTALKNASPHLYVAEAEAFPETIAAIMNDYPSAMARANAFRQIVFNEFSIEKCYQNHLPLWTARQS